MAVAGIVYECGLGLIVLVWPIAASDEAFCYSIVRSEAATDYFFRPYLERNRHGLLDIHSD